MRIRGVAKKELIHILRDPRSLIMAIGTPAMMLLLFGYALTFDLKNVPLVILDWSKTPISRELISYFQGSPYFDIKDEGVKTLQEIDHALNSRKAMIALVIPKDFAENIEKGASSSVQALVDGSDSNSATLAIEYVHSVVRRFSTEKQIDLAKKLNTPLPRPPLDTKVRVWFNPDLETRTNIVPNLIATIMMVISALLTSLTIAREWETGTMEQLISTPLKKGELMLGKLIPYFAIGILDLIIIMLLAEYLFQIPMRGSMLLLLAMSVIFLIGSLSLGLLISIIAKSQLVATQMAMVITFLPSFLLSGFLTPINNMPEVIQWMSYLVPARYFIAILRGIYLKGDGFFVLLDEILFLILFALIVSFVAYHKFKKKLEA